MSVPNKNPVWKVLLQLVYVGAPIVQFLVSLILIVLLFGRDDTLDTVLSIYFGLSSSVVACMCMSFTLWESWGRKQQTLRQ